MTNSKAPKSCTDQACIRAGETHAHTKGTSPYFDDEYPEMETWGDADHYGS